MPELPLPFINTLLLALLGLRVFSRRREPDARGALVFIAACAVATLLVGLRWQGSLPWVAVIQPLAAAALPIICWHCLRPHGPTTNGHTVPTLALLWLPVVITGMAIILRRALPLPLIDMTLILTYLGYGAALLRAAAKPAIMPATRPAARTLIPRLLRMPRLPDGAHRRRGAAGAMLILSGLLDVGVALDFGLDQGKNAVHIVACANLLALLTLAAIIARGDGAAAASAAPSPAPAPTEQDRQRVMALDALMRRERYFTDPGLTMVRLAKRLGLPGRQLSEAVNRVCGRNISQVINEYRIREAERLLTETDDNITGIMLACGFQTKSNFNREFRRVAGVSPSEFRLSAGGQASLRRDLSSR
ncbi:helix-turn-helix domain-containing protein [Acerihabitans arboris]|uniref:Helix-turn-helix domain-containing protein n=1 Tax=Acerihabitans arboris TaxID=2691583 RepID=A0A845SAL5_9GAMM|nr:helix-turn-helix domain-containing protein [Acerihabitans arboris]NDL61800.1 helix-turn-helix domain-containing protein [Acerihabitans arboris]